MRKTVLAPATIGVQTGADGEHLPNSKVDATHGVRNQSAAEFRL
jgi:hypothetical protein